MIFTLLIAALPFVGEVSLLGLSPGLSALLIQAGKAFLWGQANKIFAPKVPAQQIQASIAQAVAPRIRAYGKVLLGGVKVFREAKNGVLYQITAAHHGPISQVLQFEVDGEAVTLAAGVVTSGSTVGGNLRIYSITSGDGGNYSEVRTAFPGLWTAAHRLVDQASYLTVMTAPSPESLSQMFPRQAETAISMVVEAALVIDPRTGVLGYSDLVGPAALDYLTHADGYRIPLSMVDMDSFAAFTTICDQPVALKAGGSEKRWRIGGYYTLEDPPKDVMARILACADAQLYMTPEGKAGILGGQWVDPDVTIYADDILELSLGDGYDEFSDFNVLKGKFTSPDHRFQEVEVDELADLVALETQPVRVDTLAVDMCPSHAQLRRLMYLYRARNIRRWQGTMVTNLVGLKARFPRGDGPHVIRIEDPLDGLFIVVEVLSHSYSLPDKKCMISIGSLENAYAWDAVSQEGAVPLALDALPANSHTDPVPTGVVLTQEIVALSASTNAVRLVVTVADPGNKSLQLLAQYRAVGATLWQSMSVTSGDFRAYSPAVADGTSYEVRCNWMGKSTYSAIQTILAVSNPVAPAAATGFSRVVASPNVTLNWTNGATGFYKTRIYRGSTATFASATLIGTISGVSGQASSLVNAPGTGTWYYWAVTINASLIEATPTGPISATL